MKKIIFVLIIMFVTSVSYAALTVDQEAVLRKVVQIELKQKEGSDYFNAVTGGVYSNRIAEKTNLTPVYTETLGDELETLGFVKMLVRDSKVVYRGIQATSAGTAEISTIDTARAVVRAEVVAQAQAKRDSDIAAFKARFLSTGFTNEDWDLLRGF